MTFFDKFVEAFEKQKNDPEFIDQQNEKKRLNEEIALALATIQDEASSMGHEFFFSPPPQGSDETWTAHYKGEMFAIFNREVKNKNNEKQMNTLESVKEILMEKIKFIQ
ncbi:hypothetical protein RW092_00500 [Paenibacillus sp. 3LSP]|uniref:hypothetical protein n=1 Tax=Paenibacillus sp. 3LSP TaxID=2800795 RepID=UPI0028FD6914|nr:hypothetical protein [Paenibacillus sp. 3LSP]MDU0328683.1 hypothetical protein [Paenibacillus sp. 3LSP]